MSTSIRCRARGVTLLELLVVLMILSIVLTAAVRTWDVTLERGRAQTTASKLDQLSKVIVGDPDYIVAGQRADFGFVGDEGRLPNSLKELMVPLPDDSVWRGPYLRSTFNQSTDGYRIDGWGDTIVYGYQAYQSKDSLFVRSYGGRGVVDRTRWQTLNFPYSYQALTTNEVRGRLVDVRGDPVPDTATLVMARLMVVLYRPDGGRLVAKDTARTTEAPNFHFTSIPQGTHRLVAIYNHFDTIPPIVDSAIQNVPVYPGVGARDVVMRLPVDW
jgi:prepilin-type N-terminal cleavage/methylation domain-containing protein